ncbi:MAG TPA: hypothetical protein VLX92_08835 [Kofleriaceae bacterium]|nr:hypothetical protein [Kofleriaceae bacterium]
MSDRGRVALVLGAVAVIAGGAGFYFIKIYRPNQIARDAQHEIEAWEARWQAARDCLLGASPGSSRTSEALAIRELSPDPWQGGSCTQLMAKLSRGDAPDTGLPAVEAAWGELDHAASQAATAFAWHVAKVKGIDSLPGTLDKLDAARAALRASAGLPTSERTAPPPLPAAQVVPIRDGADPVGKLELAGVLPSAHGILCAGTTPNRMVEVQLVPGAAPRVARVGPNLFRAAPDPRWGARSSGALVELGDFDDEGAMAAPRPLGKLGDHQLVLAALGSHAAGELVYSEPGKTVGIAHVHGDTWEQISIAGVTRAGADVDTDGRAVLQLETAKGFAAQIVKPDGDEPAVVLDAGDASDACLSADRGWLRLGEEVIGFGGGHPLVRAPIQGELIGCSLDGAIAVAPEQPREAQLCGNTCRTAQLPVGVPERAALTTIGGKLVAVAIHGGVLAMWREGQPPAFYALDARLRLGEDDQPRVVALSDGKTIDVVVQDDKAYAIARITPRW